MAANDVVVVTGLGVTSPIGGDAATTWEGLLAGRSGVTRLTDPWVDDIPVKIGARVAVDPSEVLDRIEARTLDRTQQLALIAAREAWADAGAPQVEPDRLAVVIGSGVGGSVTLLEQYDKYKDRGARGVSPYMVPMMMPNGPAATVGLELGARAGVHTPVSACASGSEAIAQGLDILRAGRADVVVVGGTESCMHPLPLAGFAQMRALSTRNDDPEAASRPYDKGRDGFVMGEGAALLILETEAHANARGAKILGRLLGAGLAADSHHVTAPDPEGEGAARAVRLALKDAGLSAEDIVHINAHATSTPLGDVAEAVALREALGSALDRAAVSATKSMTGHLLGAAGALEAAVTIMALRDGKAHAIRNLDDPDDAVDLDLIRVDARQLAPGAALSTSFGFGGHDVALVFSA